MKKKSDEENFLLSSLMDMNTKIEEKFKDLIKEYKEKQFGLSFFYDIIFKQNYVHEMVYFRDEQFAGYLKIKKLIKITDDKGFELYEKLIKKMTDNIETRSFISVMKAKDPWWPYSKAHKKHLDEFACKMVKEFLTEEKIADIKERTKVS